MDGIFYLDDYNLICSNIHEQFLNGKISLYKNDIEIEFEFDCNDNRISLSFKDEYKEGDVYKVVHDNDEYTVSPRFIVQTNRFDEEYCPDINTLGSFYKKASTTFRLWAPLAEGASVVIDDEPYRMMYLGKGIYEANIKGDLENHTYHYEIIRNNEKSCFTDIFSYSNTPDNMNSYVLDTSHFKFTKVKTKTCNDPIIYETSVRDFSSDVNSPFVYKGKFKAFSEEGLSIDGSPIGIDYLASLGVSHIQLMPVNNYDLDGFDYGWGYNPIDYNTLYWGYVYELNPYAPIFELRELVDSCHIKGLKVNLDVVYNHVYKINSSSFHKMLPYYFFRYQLDGTPGDASFCGNETRSEGKFFREYIKLIVSRLIKLYDIDGLRFDLAGIIDIDTMNSLIECAKTIKKDFMMYGEGWNMGKLLADENKTIIENADSIKGFAFFNGNYRDNLKGIFSEKYTRGYLLGNKELEEKFKEALAGSKEDGLNENQTINYVECHDNYTFFDKVNFFNFDNETINSICKSGLASVILSKGIPFIHSGQEFLRSKEGSDNSYNLSDDINSIKWNEITKHIDSINYLKDLISFRRKYPVFRTDKEVGYSYYYDLLICSIDDVDIFVNPTEYPYVYNNWITYKEILLNNGDKLANLSTFDIPSYSLVVARKS